MDRKTGIPTGLIAVVLFSLDAGAATIAVIGTGNVGGALGEQFAAQGHTIIYGSREPTRADVAELVSVTGSSATAAQPRDAVADADIVILAVPGSAAVTIARALGDLSGKVLIDPTNSIDMSGEFAAYGLDGEDSLAQMIQAVQPGAHVVKAFNTVNYRVMAEPELAGTPVSIPLVGDDADAKEVAAELVEGMGMHPVDVGPLAYARVLEELLVVLANSFFKMGQPLNLYLHPMEE